MMDVLVENSKGRSVHQTRVRHACGLVVSGVRSLTVTARKTMAVSGLLLTLLLAFTLTAAPSKKQEPVSDDQIHDQVLMKLAGDIDVKGGGIDVDVHNGVVTLKGKVEKEKQRTRAERLAKKIKGVTGVENQLVLSPK